MFLEELLNVNDQINVTSGTFTQSGEIVNSCAYSGAGSGNTADKFSVLVGALNLTGGTLNLRGQHSSSSYDAMYVASGVTVSATTHTINVQPTTANDEDMYLHLNGKDVGNLTLNMNQSSEKSNFKSGINVTGALTLSTEELDIQSNTLTVAGASDIDGTLTISTGTYDANGTFDATNGNVTFTGAGY